MKESALQLAIEAAGGIHAVASAFGITRQAVEQWRVCPDRRVVDLSKLSKVPRHLLRPDLYPVEHERV